MPNLNIISPTFLERYKEMQKITLSKHFDKAKLRGLSFDFYISNAAVYSSMIEGNPIDFDTYLKLSEFGGVGGKSMQEIEDLKAAYRFAQSHPLTAENLLFAHAILTENIIGNDVYRGRVRDKSVYIFKAGEKIYTGTEPENVLHEFERFFEDIAILFTQNLSISEVFYYASMLHLVFVKIHPFADGNGRAGRLLEKWFLAQNLGEKAWRVQSERLYWERRKSYYNRLNIGTNYRAINYGKSIPFLLLLPMALRLH